MIVPANTDYDYARYGTAIPSTHEYYRQPLTDPYIEVPWQLPPYPHKWFPPDPIDLSKVNEYTPPVLKEKSDGSSTEYYKIPEGSTDLIDLIEYRNMNFAIGNIFKACFRLGEKADTDRAYDLRKIIFFAERELRRVSK